MKLTHTNLLPKTPTSHNTNILKKIFINKENIPNLMMFGSATFKPNQKVTAHKHLTMYEVFYIQKGKLDFTINQQKITATVGDCITIEPNEIHEQHNPYTENAELIYFGISIDS
ncbi:quercetin dioxygenase-like cupin family protein [Wenyingzhuangia heitensis]|uniref:Quercetin dioxygenase-like cupin family protein n=1 Tax=Wenyingzhuangia heitensis TaxID=1487859 RepID=A0ABX0UAX1_9FLAO|nr:cupin domain-containing protein [Wenyingzhuangia heitensis]NIJ45975.1 quercetin dioxygenase-like cupin family protein [Wenyingzhuangia heitensis]